MSEKNIVVVSNRGPVSYEWGSKGELINKRGAGGLVSALGPLLKGTGTMWIAAAITEADRAAAEQGMVDLEDFSLRVLNIDPKDYAMAYDVIANETLWFLHHGLFDLSRRPRFDINWQKAWQGYERVNKIFADAIVQEAPQNSIILVQDYHLALVGKYLKKIRNDMKIVHFSHTPFCSAQELAILPNQIGKLLIEAMSDYDACGFHSKRWENNFIACCKEIEQKVPDTFISPLGPDFESLKEIASTNACRDQKENLLQQVGKRQLLVRVDRMEPSKNLLRGLWAFDEMLALYPEFREKVIFFQIAYPSREELPEYISYKTEAESLTKFINDKWSTPTWQPVILNMSGNFSLSIAALCSYDALLVNPVRDGLNLVAKEGPLLNQRNGLLILSNQAGAFDELQEQVQPINPFDISQTAHAIAHALKADPNYKDLQISKLKELCLQNNPTTWLEKQLQAAQD